MEKARDGDLAAGYAEDERILAREHLEESMSMLSEELDAFGIQPVIVSNAELRSFDTLLNVTTRLISASWELVHKYRSLMRRHEHLSDVYSKISNNNVNFKKRIERLKEELEKKEYALQQSQENERRLKAECGNLSRNLKLEKDETLKLRKQSRSKDNQHEHELRRAMQNGYKSHKHLEKSKDPYSLKDALPVETSQFERKDRLELYGQIILRLEENNRFMLREISDLKQAFLFRSLAVDVHNEKQGN